MKIRPVGAELFHADGRTDVQKNMTKLRVTYRNFANAPKYKEHFSTCHSLISFYNRVACLLRGTN
jgi:hypothetical protein